MKKISFASILSLLLLTMILAACSPQIRIAWAGTSMGNEMNYRYRTFTGTEFARVEAEEGQELNVDYAVAVDKGTLTLRLVGPEEQVLWEEQYREDVQGEYSLAPTQDGTYRIGVEGDETGGSFDIAWQLAEQ